MGGVRARIPKPVRPGGPAFERQSPQPRQSAGWTTGLALLSLVLSGLLWITGLVDSLQRPSVGNSLELRQLELTALAAPALPAGLRQALTGANPLEALRLDLQKQLDGNPVPPAPQQELQLALLELQAGQEVRHASGCKS